MERNGTAADDNRTGLSVTTITPPAGLHLNDEQKANLILWVATYRQSGNRLVQEFVRMCEALYNIQTMLETQFIPFVEQHLGLTKGTAYRYLTIYRGMKLVNAGESREIDQFTKGALHLIGGQTDDDLITEIREIAKEGGSINETAVKEIIAKRNTATDADLALARAEFAKAEQLLISKQAEFDIENTRLRLENAGLSKALDVSDETLKDANEEIARLQYSETVVVEKVVEVTPEGFQTTENAIAVKKRELRAKENELAAVAAKLEATKAEEARLRELMSAAKAGKDQTDAFVLAANALIATFPAGTLAETIKQNPEVKTKVLQVVPILNGYLKDLSGL
jgi:regulator of replication initiation timing